MTPTQLITAARRKYNSVGSTFYADAEILDLLYQAELEMAKYALTIESTDSATNTVAGTRAYALPTRCISVKRLTYDGQKLKKIQFSEDDEITAYDEETTSTGTPLYYAVWGENVYLRPIPGEIKALKFYFYREPTIITVSDSIESPTRFHMDFVDGIVAEMCYKDENFSAGDRYRKRWEQHLLEARKWQKKRQRDDGFNHVKNEEEMVSTILGGI